ncbi:AMP-binding protein [Streptomyces corynorhini]|uniref:Acyl--CoA ligase n=1 Tax=Streptomyces corynorhini TaxID=2282652 RepID=A0A370B7E9_9ACTN|nr:AMP-binding protein [Streptomyces corynorhini]RDG36582.1 acyl--CoA ligase [Streptomyces corynorhini]
MAERHRDGPRDSTVEGPPLDVLARLTGGPRVDCLLSRAARRGPGRLALSGPSGDLTYATLEERATRCAAALRELAGGPGAVVGIAAVLDTSFAVAYFGASRARHVSAMFNPLLREERLTHVLRSAGARTVIVPPEMYGRIQAVRGNLPALRTVVLTHRAEGFRAAGAEVPALDELIDAAPRTAPPAEAEAEAEADPEDVANLQFTSGTTGAPKTVMLTHRNLTVNAAQTAYSHRLAPESVLLNTLPSFHLMHLNIAVTVGATHLLRPGDDLVPALREGARRGATHFYSLPVRLARLAADDRLPELSVPTLRAVLSGGSALPARTAAVLGGHFGVPVVQGYGLAETAPSTHFDDLAGPVAGSSGRPVPGTACRIVDPRTRAVLPVGGRGEIQVKGPQLMKGYLGKERKESVDPDGWFSTGDIGETDAQGRLFVVDRVKDVFKCDNWLVSPLEIENVLARCPGVKDCAVFDHPDEFSGAVAHALVVLADEDADQGAVTRFVNDQLPYYQHIKYLDVVPRIPRSPTGKIQRRDLRERALGATQRHAPGAAHDTKGTSAMFTFINRFTVRGDAAEFEKRIGEITAHMSRQPGFRSHRLLRSAKDARLYVEIAEWDDARSHGRALRTETFQRAVREVQKLASADPAPFVPVTAVG